MKVEEEEVNKKIKENKTSRRARRIETGKEEHEEQQEQAHAFFDHFFFLFSSSSSSSSFLLLPFFFSLSSPPPPFSPLLLLLLLLLPSSSAFVAFDSICFLIHLFCRPYHHRRRRWSRTRAAARTRPRLAHKHAKVSGTPGHRAGPSNISHHPWCSPPSGNPGRRQVQRFHARPGHAAHARPPAGACSHPPVTARHRPAARPPSALLRRHDAAAHTHTHTHTRAAEQHPPKYVCTTHAGVPSATSVITSAARKHVAVITTSRAGSPMPAAPPPPPPCGQSRKKKIRVCTVRVASTGPGPKHL